ncbi:MAG: hypothetical protein RLZZ28_1183 [Bacteroidota bacterium]
MRLLLAFLMAITTVGVSGQLKLPRLIGDSMVLQRDQPLPVWGWAGPGEKVTLSFKGLKTTAIADEKGKWKITLPAMPAGGPYTMDIEAGSRITLKDILIGDVWLCSGQSNMVLTMERVKEKYPEEITGATNSDIRNFFIPTISDATKLYEDLPPGKWKGATPKNVLDIGAVAYFFAKKIYSLHHVPIGIINASVGGTPIEAWISEEGFAGFNTETQRIAQLHDTAFINNHAMAVANARRNAPPPPKLQPDKGSTGPQPWYSESYIPQGWHSMQLPGYWADQGIKGLNGVVWFRKEIEITAAMAAAPAKLFLGRIIDADQAYVNGTLVGGITYQYPPRRYEIAAGLLRPGKNTIVVRVTNTAGKGGFVPDKNYSLVMGAEKIDLRGEWQYKVGQVFPAAGNTGQSPIAPINMQNEPTGLYNTMVAPLAGYPLKGMLWYQGETNTGGAAQYGNLLQALIKDWRKKWNRDDLPFLFVQLPNFNEVQYSPTESDWAVLREGQLKALSVPNTAMAVAIELGEWNDIHPLNKKDVGERLALAAEKMAYGNASIVHAGPVFKAAYRKENTIVVSFESTGTGLVAKGDTVLHYFAIAGSDKKFVWANARIEGNTVVVWSDEVPNPESLRYAWADNPEGANLYNKEGLPASPFRITIGGARQ